MKKLFLIAAVGLFSCVANASYLVWQVNSDVGNIDNIAGDWDYAVLYAVSQDGKTYQEITREENQTGLGKTGFTDEQATDISAFESGGTSTYSFYIELINSTTTPASLVGYDKKTSYADLSGSLATTLSEIPSVQTWHGGASFAAPEPTSALLMMLGVAGLALKRKQRKA